MNKPNDCVHRGYADRAKRLVDAARERATKRGLPFSLSITDVRERLERGVCEVTGIPFSLEGHQHRPFGPSIDRLSPETGYTPENIRVVVWIYNAAKGVGTHEDVLVLAKALA